MGVLVFEVHAGLMALKPAYLTWTLCAGIGLRSACQCARCVLKRSAVRRTFRKWRSTRSLSAWECKRQLSQSWNIPAFVRQRAASIIHRFVSETEAPGPGLVDRPHLYLKQRPYF